MAANKARTVHRGRIVTLKLERWRTPDGKSFLREVVEHPGAAVVVPILPDGHVVLVRQFRHAIRRWTWEVPAGTLKRGETPLACAKREVEEETGWRARRFRKLVEFFPSPGFCTERMTVFVATGLEKGRQQLDEDESIRVMSVSLADARSWIQQGKIQDAKSIIALLMMSTRR